MALKNTVKRGVQTAFKAIQDLATPMVLVRKTANSFDFGTNEVTETTQNVTCKGVVIDGKKTSKDRNVREDSVLFRTEEIVDMVAFDKIIKNGETWVLGPVIARSDYIVLAYCYKEGATK